MKLHLALAVTLLMAGLSACQISTPLVVSGTISGVDGLPPYAAFVALLSPEDYDLIGDPQMTDETGYYQLEAPGGRDYILLVIPFSGQVAEGYNLHGHTVQTTWLEAGSGDMTRDFILVPCHDFILEGYQVDERLVLNDDWVGVRFAEDMTGNATTDYFIGIGKGEGTPEVPGVCIPLGQMRRFFVQWEVPDFGNVVLAADNGGDGFVSDEPGGTVLNLNYELARTQVVRLNANLREYLAAGYDVPPDSAAELNETETSLAKAAAQTGVKQAAISDMAASMALWALEDLEQVRAKQDINRNRMGDITITVLDAEGNPLPAATVTYAQTSHNFLFGAFSSLENAGIEGYELMQEAGINYLTAGFYWVETEPEQDQIAWEYIDHGVGVLDLAKMGFNIKAHALMALWDFGTPDYLKSMSFNVYDHISELVSRYRDQIDTWNVINEAHGRGAALDLSRAEITTLTNTGIRAVHENDPHARIIINNSFDWYGETGTIAALMGETDDFTLSIPAYLDQLAADGVDYDVIGQQLYNGGYVSILADWGLGDPMGVSTWDLAHVSALLDRLGEYGKPVHVTEQSVPSTWDSDWIQYGAGWWHRPWDEETQAEFVRDFYTIAFSKEHVEAITWWDITDNSFIFTGGLLDKNNQPKPAYFMMRDLIASWTSSGQVQTDSTGKATIRGYGGEYELTVNYDGQTWSDMMYIMEQQNGEYVARTGLQK